MGKIAALTAAAFPLTTAPAAAEPAFLTSYYATGWTLQVDGAVPKDGDQAYSVELSISGACPAAQMLSTPKMGVGIRLPFPR